MLCARLSPATPPPLPLRQETAATTGVAALKAAAGGNPLLANLPNKVSAREPLLQLQGFVARGVLARAVLAGLATRNAFVGVRKARSSAAGSGWGRAET